MQAATNGFVLVRDIHHEKAVMAIVDREHTWIDLPEAPRTCDTEAIRNEDMVKWCREIITLIMGADEA